MLVTEDIISDLTCWPWCSLLNVYLSSEVEVTL